MVPDEWPILADAQAGRRVPARVAGSRRLPVVRIDFFLDPRARLTEQERALMTAMLTDLVNMVADEFRSMLADAEPANDEGEQLIDRLWASGLLDIPELVRLLLRRSEEERIASGIRAGRPASKMRFLQSLVGDADANVSGAAMALILARGRRRDHFDGPRLNFDDLSAETAVALVNAIAAAFRADLVKRLGAPDVDERLAAVAAAILGRHDEGNRIEAKAFDLVHALDSVDRLDEALLRSALEEGEVLLLVEVLARRAGIGFGCAWDHFTAGDGRLSLLLRMSNIERDLAGEILAVTAEVVASDAEREITAFDQLTPDKVESARKWFRLDPGYRSAVGSMGGGDGERTV